jgi:hypothetical protein
MFLFTWLTTEETKLVLWRVPANHGPQFVSHTLGTRADGYTCAPADYGEVIQTKVTPDGNAFCNYEIRFNIWRLFSVRRDAM